MLYKMSICQFCHRSSSSITHIMHRTLHDVFVSHRILIPVIDRSDIDTTLRTAAFFVHALLTLGLEYQHKFSSSKILKIC